MNPKSHLETMDAGDTLIVGAGVAGLLTAVELKRRGEGVTVIDSTGVGAGQSGHHHGLVHHGTLYVGSSDSLISALAEGREGWSEWLEEISPTADRAILPIWDPFKVNQAVEWWQRFGLSFEQVAQPSWIRGTPTVFGTNEATYDFTSVLRRICDQELPGATMCAGATRLEQKNGRVTGVIVQLPGGQKARLIARKYVLAAGCGLASLLADSGILRLRLTMRTSFMMVLDAPSLPSSTMMAIEPELGGLFTGARYGKDGIRWLVGDHLSIGGSAATESLGAAWLHATIELLDRTTRLLDEAGVRVGMYMAPKAELRDDPASLSPYAVETYGLANAIVITPTKLTLAPALARRACEVLGRIRQRPDFTADSPALGEELRVVEERWAAIQLVPIEQVGGWYPHPMSYGGLSERRQE
jgi:glycine/D-amino acid oxidase-like deaminating enzyme